MRLSTRLRTLEARFRPADEVPGLLLVFEHEPGVWDDGRGTTIDPADIDPRTQVIVIRQRPDGPH
jgi:hypothetical protein